MNRSKERLRVRLVGGVVAACLTLAASIPSLDAQSFPRYDHVFLVIMENENYKQGIGNQHAPILNALAQDSGAHGQRQQSDVPTRGREEKLERVFPEHALRGVSRLLLSGQMQRHS